MARSRVIPILVFPIVLTLGIALIPVVSDYSNHHLAVQAVEKTGRWFAGHLISAVAFGLSVWASSVIAAELHHRSIEIPSFLLPMIAVGAALFAAGLGADGIGPVAVQSSGVSPIAFFDGSGWWVTGVFIAATLLFGVGLIVLVIHAIRGGLVVGGWRYFVFISALIFVSAPAIPSGWALYGEAIASLGVFVPIGISIWRSG